MPIKWSVVSVGEAMDEVEYQVSLAEPFLAEARFLGQRQPGR